MMLFFIFNLSSIFYPLSLFVGLLLQLKGAFLKQNNKQKTTAMYNFVVMV